MTWSEQEKKQGLELYNILYYFPDIFHFDQDQDPEFNSNYNKFLHQLYYPKDSDIVAEVFEVAHMFITEFYPKLFKKTDININKEHQEILKHSIYDIEAYHKKNPNSLTLVSMPCPLIKPDNPNRQVLDADSYARQFDRRNIPAPYAYDYPRDMTEYLQSYNKKRVHPKKPSSFNPDQTPWHPPIPARPPVPSQASKPQIPPRPTGPTGPTGPTESTFVG